MVSKTGVENIQATGYNGTRMVPKGQLISKRLFCLFKSTKKNKKIVRISGVASKYRSNQKTKALYYTN